MPSPVGPDSSIRATTVSATSTAPSVGDGAGLGSAGVVTSVDVAAGSGSADGLSAGRVDCEQQELTRRATAATRVGNVCILGLYHERRTGPVDDKSILCEDTVIVGGTKRDHETCIDVWSFLIGGVVADWL